MTKQYVHDGLEVVLTGRTAVREIPARGRSPRRVDMKHEIEPADKEQGSFKKWVRLDDLYLIEEKTSDET